MFSKCYSSCCKNTSRIKTLINPQSNYMHYTIINKAALILFSLKVKVVNLGSSHLIGKHSHLLCKPWFRSVHLWVLANGTTDSSPETSKVTLQHSDICRVDDFGLFCWQMACLQLKCLKSYFQATGSGTQCYFKYGLGKWDMAQCVTSRVRSGKKQGITHHSFEIYMQIYALDFKQ